MSQLLDRVQVGTSTTGTGTMTLGTAASTFQTFASAGAVNGATYSYLIQDGLDWEIGFGVYNSSGATLTRNLVASSTTALLNLSGNAVVSVVESAGVGTTGGWQPISEVVTAASQTHVTFTSIPQTFRDLKLIIRARGNFAAVSVNTGFQINGDTTASYIREFIDAVQAGLSSGMQPAVGQVFSGRIPAGTAPANVSGISESTLYDYRGTTFTKVINTFGVNVQTATTAGELVFQGNVWLKTAAINAIDVFLDNGGFVDGSVVSLYGQQ